MTPLAVVPLRAEHVAPLERILRETPEFTSEEVEVALEVLTDAVASGDDYGCLVAVREGEVLGYACFGHTPMTERAFDLYWIAVAPNAKRGGVGRALMDAVLGELRGRASVLRVETESGAKYAPTRLFYERIGFEIAGTIRDFYGADRGLVVFVKYLSNR